MRARARVCVWSIRKHANFKRHSTTPMSQRVSDAGPFDDVCKYRSSMINCSCQDTRYFARAYRKPVSTGERIPHIIFVRSPTVGEFSSFPSPTPFVPPPLSSAAKLSRDLSLSLSFITILTPPRRILNWKRRDTCAPFRASNDRTSGWKRLVYFDIFDGKNTERKFLLFARIVGRLESKNRIIRY